MDDFPVIDSGVVIGPPFLGFKLLATGQTTKYVEGDDGDLEFGEKKAYEILTTGQFSGTTAITVNGKTDNHSNNVVKDIKTGLMLSRYVSASVGPGSNGKLPWTTTGAGPTAEGIFPYVAAANVALLGGYSDWRVANKTEFKSIQDEEISGAYPNSTAFPSFAFPIWTSTTVKFDSTTAYYCPGGDMDGTNKTGNYLVLLVRGG